jgi:ubiquinone/menaquinone biosynthesis C-methylase UbiE
MDQATYQQILEENIKLHKIEARHYEALHPEEFNWFEQGQLRQDLEQLRQHLTGERVVLDLGCGTGSLTLKLLDLGFDIQGVDLSEAMLEVLRSRIPAPLASKVKLFAANVDDFLNRCQERYDLIVISSVLHHLPEYVRSLEKALGLLKPGGWIYITHEPTRKVFSPDRFLRKILWQVDNVAYGIFMLGRRPRVGARSYKMSDYQLYHGFDEEAVAACCLGAGFKIVKFVRYASAMRLGISCWIYSRWLGSEGQFSLMAQKNS